MAVGQRLDEQRVIDERPAPSVSAPRNPLELAMAPTLLAAGVNVKVVSEALGHSKTAFTMDVYAHVLPTMGEQAAAAIQSALGA